ncbi:3-dehydroquinate synthase II [Paenibacillus tianjinensis]|uniref:3-amino-4-hydroxybenzoic acid synthase n=1 Tax=Paenibacillus tianjinensis TaxID=2810347 RepID=A0ABX7L893_9BACL|nr:3-dehydroquinate synthase II [Paenibacillus tianjinensis]QSF44393.1 hypothetical protein JRJ22_24805 [Paenibacillus tianjinensis]
MEKEREIWFEATADTKVDTIDKVCQLNYSTIYIDYRHFSLLGKIQLPQRMELAVLVSEMADVENLVKEPLFKKVKYIVANNLKLLQQTKVKLNGQNIKIALTINVKDRETLDQTVELVNSVDLVIIEFKDPTNIPLELILATTQLTSCQVFKKVRTAEDGEVSLMTMEVGSDGIVLSTNQVQDIIRFSETVSRSKIKKFELREGVVKKIRHTGMGSRVCIDTTSELYQDEGMLLGSTSSGGILTCSETHFLPYMNLRQFRVNAGGLHLYAWVPGDRAVYLSDIKAGDEVYIVNSKGEARVVTVGRLKIESRPLLYIECEVDGTILNTFIQDDWHVRMMGGKGEIRPSSEIKIGDKLLVHLDVPGRHVGLKILETIREV